MSDFPKIKDGYPDPFGSACDTYEEAREQVFRRGYSQGVAAAFQALRAGYSPQQIEAFSNRVYAWRCKRHRGKIEFPEWLGRTTKIKPDGPALPSDTTGRLLIHRAISVRNKQ